jgi:hypothetical protein
VLKTSTISRKSPAIADRAKALTPPTALQGREREDAASIRREKQKRPTAVLGDELDAGKLGYVADRIISVLKSKGLNLGQAPR